MADDNIDVQEEVQLIIAHARQCLSAAYLLHKEECFPDAINRAYYCVFHCARALLLKDYSETFKKHTSLISRFREVYIKSGAFEKRLSIIIGTLYDERNGSDYNERFFIGGDVVESRINDAEYFYSVVCKHIGIDG